MAEFKPVFERWSKIEGFYTNDPDDLGGETFCGISKVYNRSWPGWVLIDQGIRGGVELQRLVDAFYRSSIWDRFRGDEIPVQKIADELFDVALHRGVHQSVSWMQEALNLLAKCPPTRPQIDVDGVVGTQTLNALSIEAASKHDASPCISLYKLMNILQGEYYKQRIQEMPTQGKYLRGWLKRVTC